MKSLIASMALENGALPFGPDCCPCAIMYYLQWGIPKDSQLLQKFIAFKTNIKTIEFRTVNCFLHSEVSVAYGIDNYPCVLIHHRPGAKPVVITQGLVDPDIILHRISQYIILNTSH